MKQLRSFGATLLAALLLVCGQLLSLPTSAVAGPSAPPVVPGAIAVPAGSVLLFSRHALGVQIYECQNGQWIFHAPQALLFAPQPKKLIGIHYGALTVA